MISIFGDERTVIRAVQAGADGYLLKDGPPGQIARAILELVEGGSPLSAPVARYLLRLAQRPGSEGVAEERDSGSRAHVLTTREVEVLKLFAKGFSTPEIAELLDISPHTVIAHGRSIHRKLEVGSRTAAVYEAVNLGIIRLPE